MQAGEFIKIKVQRYGKELRQGVGYLDDGTMVVVNGAEIILVRRSMRKCSPSSTPLPCRTIFCNAIDEENLFDEYEEDEDSPTNTEHSPILGIGNDIVIPKIRKKHSHAWLAADRATLYHQRATRLFEIKDPVPHFAGRFPAKEAIVKALGTGFGEHASWLDIEILNDSHGKPSVYFSTTLEKKTKGTSMQVSISHCQLYVTAFAIWVKS